jgi:hypothetical protein
MSTDLKDQVCGIISESIQEERASGICHVCNEKKKVRHIDLNVFGPRGTKVCEECELKIIEFVFNISVPEKSKIDNRNNNPCMSTQQFLRK